MRDCACEHASRNGSARMLCRWHSRNESHARPRRFLAARSYGRRGLDLRHEIRGPPPAPAGPPPATLARWRRYRKDADELPTSPPWERFESLKEPFVID